MDIMGKLSSLCICNLFVTVTINRLTKELPDRGSNKQGIVSQKKNTCLVLYSKYTMLFS